MSNPVRNDATTSSKDSYKSNFRRCVLTSQTLANMNPSSDQYTSSKAADPETASIATFSSTAPLVKKDKQKQKQKKETEIDVQKLQEQALRSQIRFSM